MVISKSHIIKLYPTFRQVRFFKESCGVARFSYNWALNRWQELYSENGNGVGAYRLVKELNTIKREQYPWMLRVGKTCPQYAIHNLERAYKNFFNKKSKYPKFKKKGVKDSFVAVENQYSFKQQNGKIWIPRLGWVKCAEDLRFKDCKINRVTVKRIADMWFAVVNVETHETPVMSKSQAVIGVDLGIKTLATASDGRTYENPNALKKYLRLLKIRQKALSRKQKGSNKREKQKVRVSRLNYKISCTRDSALHRVTRELVNSAKTIVIEDLNVSGMVKNRCLSQAISDVSFGEFRRQLEYKAGWASVEIIVADRFYPSTKRCSNCGNVKADIKLSERLYICNNCNSRIDRDLNAAINLLNYTPEFGRIQARGDDARPVGTKADIYEAGNTKSRRV